MSRRAELLSCLPPYPTSSDSLDVEPGRKQSNRCRASSKMLGVLAQNAFTTIPMSVAACKQEPFSGPLRFFRPLNEPFVGIETARLVIPRVMPFLWEPSSHGSLVRIETVRRNFLLCGELALPVLGGERQPLDRQI
jgi:hypothetical protein